jgi:hypothetical protein
VTTIHPCDSAATRVVLVRLLVLLLLFVFGLGSVGTERPVLQLESQLVPVAVATAIAITESSLGIRLDVEIEVPLPVKRVPVPRAPAVWPAVLTLADDTAPHTTNLQGNLSMLGRGTTFRGCMDGDGPAAAKAGPTRKRKYEHEYQHGAIRSRAVAESDLALFVDSNAALFCLPAAANPVVAESDLAANPAVAESDLAIEVFVDPSATLFCPPAAANRQEKNSTSIAVPTPSRSRDKTPPKPCPTRSLGVPGIATGSLRSTNAYVANSFDACHSEHDHDDIDHAFDLEVSNRYDDAKSESHDAVGVDPPDSKFDSPSDSPPPTCRRPKHPSFQVKGDYDLDKDPFADMRVRFQVPQVPAALVGTRFSPFKSETELSHCN